MRVVTWNLNGAKHAGRATHAQQASAWETLSTLGADVALLQEVEPAAIPSSARDRWAIHGEESTWGSLVAVAKHVASDPAAREHPWLEIVGNYVALASVDLLGERVLFASVHAPATVATEFLRTTLRKPDAIPPAELGRIARPGIEAWALDIIFDALAARVGGRFVVGGDLNEARLFDEKYPARFKGAGGAFFARAEERGWRECGCEGGEQRTFLKPGSASYQLDHLFCDPQTRGFVRGVTVGATAGAEGISDHLPLVMDIELPAGG